MKRVYLFIHWYPIIHNMHVLDLYRQAETCVERGGGWVLLVAGRIADDVQTKWGTGAKQPQV